MADDDLYGKGRGQRWQSIPSSANTTVKTPRNWGRICFIIAAVIGFLLLVGVIFVPTYVTLVMAAVTTTSTTSTTTTVFLPSQCTNYTLDTDATRSTNYTTVMTGCDNIIYATPIWVRYGGNATRMATSAPPIYRCATYATGWFTGTLPSTTGATVTGAACYAWTSTICDFENVISVTNCGGYYIYLVSSPPQCYLRYCTE